MTSLSNVSPVADAVLRARRMAREWVAKNDAPPAVERRLAAAILEAITVHEVTVDDGLVETMGREVVAKFADVPTAPQQRARAAAMVRGWRGEVPR